MAILTTVLCHRPTTCGYKNKLPLDTIPITELNCINSYKCYDSIKTLNWTIKTNNVRVYWAYLWVSLSKWMAEINRSGLTSASIDPASASLKQSTYSIHCALESTKSAILKSIVDVIAVTFIWNHTFTLCASRAHVYAEANRRRRIDLSLSCECYWKCLNCIHYLLLMHHSLVLSIARR